MRATQNEESVMMKVPTNNLQPPQRQKPVFDPYLHIALAMLQQTQEPDFATAFERWRQAQPSQARSAEAAEAAHDEHEPHDEPSAPRRVELTAEERRHYEL